MKHDPNHLTARDMFMMSTLTGITQGVMAAYPDPAGKLKAAEHFAPEIAAIAGRIADAVMADRKAQP
jgi:hypothetical protein